MTTTTERVGLELGGGTHGASTWRAYATQPGRPEYETYGPDPLAAMTRLAATLHAELVAATTP